jgi:hypothetical protein
MNSQRTVNRLQKLDRYKMADAKVWKVKHDKLMKPETCNMINLGVPK